MCTEGVIGLWQGLAAGSVALTGWALGSAVEGLASVSCVRSPDIPTSLLHPTPASYITGTELAAAAVQNQAGNYVQPTAAAITADAAGRPDITPGSFSIVNEPGSASYPICGYSWVLLSARQPSTAGGKALTSLISWLTHAGQSYAADLGYVPLPPTVQQLATTTLAASAPRRPRRATTAGGLGVPGAADAVLRIAETLAPQPLQPPARGSTLPADRTVRR